MTRKRPETFEGIYLASDTSVEDIRAWLEKRDKEKIADFILKRFLERYLEPVVNSTLRNGFAMMAIGCLMIEALESFYQGWNNSSGHKGEDIFNGFFNRFPSFAEYRGIGTEFYKHIRCGILHQAETTGGWIIRRDCLPSDPTNKVVNAEEFIKNLQLSLNEYHSSLLASDWESEVWENCRKKLNHIIKNCIS